MSGHNICFREEIRKNISTFRLKKKAPYLELCRWSVSTFPVLKWCNIVLILDPDSRVQLFK